MYSATWQAYDLDPTFPLGTSRGTIRKRKVWFLILRKRNALEHFGLGEAAPLPGLSIENELQVESALQRFCDNPSLPATSFAATPSVRFAIEMALDDLMNGGTRLLFNSDFQRGVCSIPINGLIWMGDKDEMLARLREKMQEGYRCMKLKIGAIDHNEEMALISTMRQAYPSSILEIRVDANGAYSLDEAKEVMKELAGMDVHSIEQPIKAGQMDGMAELCDKAAIPIALDEELIGVTDKKDLLRSIKPQFIILKPTLLGGLQESSEWIELAEQANIGWWVTSALESNVGLNAIAQWTATLNNPLPQGLGTGAMFQNNIGSPLNASAGLLHYNKHGKWDMSALNV